MISFHKKKKKKYENNLVHIIKISLISFDYFS